MHPRLLTAAEQEQTGYTPPDYDKYKQCYNCGKIIAVVDIMRTGRLTTDAPKLETKFDLSGGGAKIHGIGEDRHLGTVTKRGKNPREHRNLGEIDDIDLKKDLKDPASKLLSYSET